MMTPNLIDVPKDSPTRKERFSDFKAEHWIWTHKTNGMDYPWTALAYAHGLEMLKGYDLTEDQRNDPILLIAGYCRLLDEAGLLVTGNTERAAVRELCGNLKITCP